jgi:hypothetical protein
MVKKKVVRLFLPEDVYAYLREKCKTMEGADSYITKLVRAEMDIDFKRPAIESDWYRTIRRRVKEMHDAGTQLTADTLAAKMGRNFSVQQGRDWLARMEKDGYVVLIKRAERGRKIYQWAGKVDKSD